MKVAKIKVAKIDVAKISMTSSIVFHENKKVNLVLEVEDTLCAMTLEIDTELKKEAFCFFNDICQWSILYIL